MPCMPPQGPTDVTTRCASCWWVNQLGVAGAPRGGFGGGPLAFGGRHTRGFSLGATNGTTDQNLLNAANALLSVNDLCNLTTSGATVAAFQTAWNATSDPNMQSSLDASNNAIGTLTVDGKYGAETSAAAQNALGQQSPSPCTAYTGSYGSGGGGGTTSYSAAVVAAAKALDAQLAAQGCCGAQVVGSALSNATSAFKQAILVTASDWGTNSAAQTVTGSTINVSSGPCQIAFGSELGGTLADLRAVLGSAMTYTGSYCSDSSCQVVNAGTNCSGGVTPPAPPAPPGPSPAPSSSTTSSSGSGALIAVAVLGGLGAAAVTYAVKRRKKKQVSAYARY